MQDDIDAGITPDMCDDMNDEERAAMARLDAAGGPMVGLQADDAYQVIMFLWNAPDSEIPFGRVFVGITQDGQTMRLMPLDHGLALTRRRK